MHHATRQLPVFSRGSHVLDYWLANAEGLRLERRGLRSGRVLAVVSDPESGRARALVVRSLLTGRRRLVPVAEVAGVSPANELLLLERRASGPGLRERLRPVLAILLALAATAGRLGGRLRVEAPRRTQAAIAWSRPRGAAAGRSAIGHARTAAGWSRRRGAAAGGAAVEHARTAAAASRGGAAWLRPRAVFAARLAAAFAAALAIVAVEFTRALAVWLWRELQAVAAVVAEQARGRFASGRNARETGSRRGRELLSAARRRIET